MMLVDHLAGIISISACFWIVLWFCACLRINRFIVKRYEQETDLLNNNFFTNHVPFAKYLPNFFSSAIYTGHLMMCLWGWPYFGSRKVFNDVTDPSAVTHYFTKKEIRKVKIHAISLLIVFMHFIAYYIFQYIWPDVFD